MKNRGKQRGQSILEYLVIATVIIGVALALVNGAFRTNAQSLYTNAGTRVGDAATSLHDNLHTEQPAQQQQ